MKVGKVSQTVLKRSLLKPLQFHREESMFPPSVEEMCYGIKTGEGEEVLSSTAVLYGNEKDLGVFALAQAANDLCTFLYGYGFGHIVFTGKRNISLIIQPVFFIPTRRDDSG